MQDYAKKRKKKIPSPVNTGIKRILESKIAYFYADVATKDRVSILHLMIPKQNCVVPTAARQKLTIRRECDSTDSRCVSLKSGK